MRKSLPTILSVGLLFGALAPSVSAGSTEITQQESTISSNQVVPQASLQFSNDATQETLSAAGIIKTFTFTNLANEVASAPFQINGSGDVNISVHQRTADSKYSPVIQYTLQSSDYSQSIFINGTFTNTNTIRTFTNVPEGTYKIVITNYGGASNVFGDGRLYR
ncbi:hypothetical protein [Paenibacillus polymyxa]|uniref:hypothetical protein n=1 Tax=Paenibacillus polymyxa TaxID=1406 RepID=UPI00083E604B|nr:hypothetical protein [Paenibacillus polymyxa]ODB61376.1 hypothetical protein A7309_15125 [Paenibacillus polymyxa]